ncbi:MAG: SAM-dependent methyltransferase [Ruminococcaceae bacterium]|nr:SAM-dependent methyltransferase [Oscillospiraceae bacterium]
MREPDQRLRAAAELVRQGAVFADIGTDHALLPVFLCKMGRVSRAVAADINIGPLAAARTQVENEGLSHMVKLVLTDGLAGLEREGLTDIAVCGMGGELIVSILDRAPFIKNAGIRLILQPMTHASDLRYYLARTGFRIVEERTAFAKGKCYFCLAAEYTGECYTLTRTEASFGCRHTRKPSDALLSLVQKEKRGVEKKCRGLRKGGRPDEGEEEYLSDLCALIKELEV